MNSYFIEIIDYIVLQLLCFISMEYKMEHPFKPYAAFKSFINKRYNDRFVFKEKNKQEYKIDCTNNALLEGFQDQKELSTETLKLVRKNNHLLKVSDFPYEIRNTANLIISDVIKDFKISKSSEQIVSDFLLRKKSNGKIVFTKTATNGVSIRPILDFFSVYTDLFERCQSGDFTQVNVKDLINAMVQATDKRGTPVNNPIDTKNLSNYLKK